MLGLPFHYRDERVNDDVMTRAHARVPREELYRRTGIQTMPINTIYQLVAEDRSGAAVAGEAIALVPDLFNLWLTGELANEATIASTTGLLEATGRRWARDLIARLQIPERPFGGEVRDPGQELGSVLERHGPVAGTAVHLVASHDTASAFAGTPLRGPDAAVLSSGTWSLLGVEIERADARRRRRRLQPDQRAWRRGHDPAASQRDGSVAAPGMPARVERRRSRARLRRAPPARRRGAGRRARCSTRITRRCSAAATCRR